MIFRLLYCPKSSGAPYLVIAGRRTAENKIGEIFLIVWFTTAYPHSPSSRFDRSVEPQPDRSHTQDGRKGATHEEDSDCVFGPCLHHHHRFTCFHLSAAALPLTAAPLLPTRRLCFCGTLNVKKSRWSDLVPKIKAPGERGEWRWCNEGFLYVVLVWLGYWLGNSEKFKGEKTPSAFLVWCGGGGSL